MILFKTRSSTLTLAFALFLFLSGGVSSVVADGGTVTNVTYTYDELNRLTSVTYPNRSTITYTYDAAGNRLTYVGAEPEAIVPTLKSVTHDPVVFAGGAVELEVIATDAASYQWYRGESGDESDPVPGANGATLEVTGGAAGSYWVKVFSVDGVSADSDTIRVERMFMPSVARTAGGDFQLSFPTVAGRYYRIWGSSDLRNWTSHDTIIGNGLAMEWANNKGQSEAAHYFFRVEILLNPAPEGFALIPAGEFEMGDHLDGWSSELPVHTVYVSDFYMGRTSVTKAQWDAVRSWAVNNGYTDLPAGGGKGLDHPVHSVSWYDAVKWLNAWSEKDGLNPLYRVSDEIYRSGQSTPSIDYSANGYRLPTEAEWEKAARGGLDGRRFPWGDTISHDEANYWANGDAYSYDVSPYSTWTLHPDYDDGTMPYMSPVGSFAPNGYGLYDMAGNVWEWCNDWYSRTYYSSSPGVDPDGPSSGTSRVIRGGSWGGPASYARVSFRHNYSPGDRRGNSGFRPARTPSP